MIIKPSGIEFLRGDDDGLLIGLLNGAKFTTGDEVYFCVRNTARDDTDLVHIKSTTFVPYKEVENAGCVITIPRSSTVNVELDDYVYVVFVRWGATGHVRTLVPPKPFTLAAGGSHVALP